jgi:hypothetical protein
MGNSNSTDFKPLLETGEGFFVGGSFVFSHVLAKKEKRTKREIGFFSSN